MPDFKNYLYDHPDFYDAAFPDKTSSSYCLGAIERHAQGPVKSILDLGCGTGSTLEILSRRFPDCVGVDFLASMISWGKKVRPNLDLQLGDMQVVDLSRTFDVICCFGWAFSYLLTERELQSGVSTFARHAHPGTLAVLDCGNAEAYLAMEELPNPVTEIDTPIFKASARAKLDLDHERLLLRRERTWALPNGEKAEDFCTFRLHRPEALVGHFQRAGFKVLELAGDPSGKLLAPGERTLFMTAVKI